MTPLDALAKILLLSQSLDNTITAAPDAKLPQVAVGQQVTAKIQELLQNGNFRVSINDQPLQMSLPQGLKPGDTVSLVLISREPRLTFNLEMPQQSMPQQQTPVLSQAGKLVAQLLPDSSKPNPPLTSSAPILPSPPQDPKQLAQALKSALSQSGLFYESHQAQWLKGELPLAQLLHEPQNIPVQAQTLPQESAATVQTMLPKLETMTAAAPSAKPPESSSSSSEAAIPVKQDALPIVRQQIGVLETREINWSGQVWPGQTMDWQVREEGHERRAPDEPPFSWQSRLRLALPRLGEVDANLRLTSKGVQIALQAATSESGNQMKENGTTLQESLKACGVPLISMTVRHG